MSQAVKVFLAGEGKNELGGLIGHPSWHNDEKGVLRALLERVKADGWSVGGAREWKKIRKFRAHGAVDAETQNVLGVALDALEAGCKILAFTRDQDNDARRREAIEEGIRRVPLALGEKAPDVIGSVAVPTLEGWILALLGERATEVMSKARAAKDLEARGISPKNAREMVSAVEDADIAAVPDDAKALALWLARAREVTDRHVRD